MVQTGFGADCCALKLLHRMSRLQALLALRAVVDVNAENRRKNPTLQALQTKSQHLISTASPKGGEEGGAAWGRASALMRWSRGKDRGRSAAEAREVGAGG